MKSARRLIFFSPEQDVYEQFFLLLLGIDELLDQAVQIKCEERELRGALANPACTSLEVANARFLLYQLYASFDVDPFADHWRELVNWQAYMEGWDLKGWEEGLSAKFSFSKAWDRVSNTCIVM